MTDILENGDERRLQVQTYHEWVRAANGKLFPSLSEMDGVQLATFKESSFILKVNEDVLNPKIIYVGNDLLEDCGSTDNIRTLQDVPQRSLLSRLSEHYLECYSNRAPVGFEAGFQNWREQDVKYRGIILPLSSDGETIDHIWGTINSKVEQPLILNGKNPRKKPHLKLVESKDELSEIISALSNERKAFVERVGAKLQDLLEIEGVSTVALVDRESRASLAVAGDTKEFDLQRLAAGCAKELSEQQAMLNNLGLESEEIEGLLFSLTDHFHMIQPIRDDSGRGLFVLVVSDKTVDNLAMTRFKVAKFEREISQSITA